MSGEAESDLPEPFGEEKLLSLWHTWEHAQPAASSLGSSQFRLGHQQSSAGTLPCPEMQCDSPACGWGRVGLSPAGTDQSRHTQRALCSPLYRIPHCESSKHTGTLTSTFCVQGTESNERLKLKEGKQILLNSLAIFGDVHMVFHRQPFFRLHRQSVHFPTAAATCAGLGALEVGAPAEPSIPPEPLMEEQHPVQSP